MYALYNFKEDYCRQCLRSIEFNNIETWIDTKNHSHENTCKMSWNSYYYMYCDEEDNVYHNKKNLQIWR